MNGTLDFDVNIGIGPQLVIVGAIFGSILVGTLSYFLGGTIFNQENLLNSIAESSGEGNLETYANDQNIDERMNNCQVSNNFSIDILKWCQEISQYSTHYELSPDLIAAVMLQESGGNPTAYSHSGAVGLMQVMPRDGIAASFMCINGPCFANRPSIQELQDPDFNIEFGTRMLANLLNKYGNIRDALKSYGPKDVGYTYADKVLAIYENFR